MLRLPFAQLRATQLAVVLLATVASLACGSSGCTSANSNEPKGPPTATRGRQLYVANCIACHNGDPSKDGAIGPAVAGASRELIEARVMRATYPEGYTPKRTTKSMVALPHLSGGIDDLAAYLKSTPEPAPAGK